MTSLILHRRDKLNKSNSYLEIYDLKPLSLIENEFKNNILRIIKKSILGTNFCYRHKRHSIFISLIVNFFIINTYLMLHNLYFNNAKEFIEIDLRDTNENNTEKKKTLPINGINYIYKLSINNFIDIGIFLLLSFIYKYKEEKLKKYMETYTQCSINQENDSIKKKYFCEILNNDNFDIEIKDMKNNKHNYDIKNEKIFFEYIINIPNIRKISDLLYNQIFTEKEKEIIRYINIICDEIDFKYIKKMIFIYISIISGICIFNFSLEKDLFLISIITIIIFAQGELFFKNRNSQIKIIDKLNTLYIKDGYFIYINSDIISIFYLKEEYKINGDITEIKKLNEKLMKKYKIKF